MFDLRGWEQYNSAYCYIYGSSCKELDVQPENTVKFCLTISQIFFPVPELSIFYHIFRVLVIFELIGGDCSLLLLLLDVYSAFYIFW